MEVAIAGGHGKIALMLGGLLVERGNAVFGLIRDPAQEDDLHAVGVEPVICDIEGDDDLAEAVSGAEAVVFAAGAGPGSGAERKWTVDYGGAVKLIDAAKAEGIERYVMVSAMGAAEPPSEGARSSASTCAPRPRLTALSSPAASPTRSSAPAGSPTIRPPAGSRSASASSAARFPAPTSPRSSPRCWEPTTRSARRST